MSIFRTTPAEKAEKALTISAMWTKLVVKNGTVTQLDGGRVTGPVAGSVASVGTEGQIRERFTATRILALGVFALAFKKKVDERDVFITIEHPDYTICAQVPAKRSADARKWAADYNALARSLAFPG